MSKRNLAPNQISYLRGKRYNLEKKGYGGDRKSEISSRHYVDLIKTAEKIAIENNVVSRTIERDAKYSDAVDDIAKNIPQQTGIRRALVEGWDTNLAVSRNYRHGCLRAPILSVCGSANI